MTLSQNLLYLLLLYAVLDKGNTLSLTTGVLIGAGILLFNCYNTRTNCCNTNRCCCSNNTFAFANGL